MKILRYKYPRVVITKTTILGDECLLGAKDISDDQDVDTLIDNIRFTAGLNGYMHEVCFYDSNDGMHSAPDCEYRDFCIDYHDITNKQFSMVLCLSDKDPEFHGFVPTLSQALSYIDKYWFEKGMEAKHHV